MQKNGFLRFLNFEILWSGVLLKILYVICNIILFLFPLFTLAGSLGAFFLALFFIMPIGFLVIRLIFEAMLISIQKAEYQKRILYCLQEINYQRQCGGFHPGGPAPGYGPVPGNGPIPGGYGPATGNGQMPGGYGTTPDYGAAPGTNSKTDDNPMPGGPFPN